MNSTPVTITRKPIDVPPQAIVTKAADDSRGAPRRMSPLEVIRRRWWSLAIVVVVSLAATYLYERKLTPLYTSSARLYVQQSGPKILSSDPQGGGNAESYLYIQGELVKSSGLIEQALRLPAVRDLKMLAGANDPAAAIRAALRVDIDYKYDILSILCDSVRAEDAAKLVDAIVETYVIYQNEQKKLTSAEVVKVLQREKEKREAELSDKYRQVAEFRKTNGTISISETDKGNIVVQRLSLLSSTLTTAQLEVMGLKTSDEIARQVKGDPERVLKLADLDHAEGVGADVWRSRISQLDAELAAARRQLSTLRGKQLGENHREVSATREQIASLEVEISLSRQKAAEDYVDLVHRRLIAAQQREAQLQKDFDAQQNLAFQLNSKAAECSMLEAEVRRLEKLSDMIDTRIKEIHVSNDSGPMNVTVLQSADLPTVPSSPQKARAMGIAAGVGLFLGVCCAFFLEWSDGRVRSTQEITSAFRVRILAVIPRKRRGTRAVGTVGRSVELDPHSDYAEAFRRLRATLCSTRLQSLSRCLLITSPSASDGKSVVVSNLGIALAHAGRRTLIIDGDLRRPSQHSIFGLENSVGLSEVLVGSRKVQELIRYTGVINLDIVTTGQSREEAVRLLGSAAFVQLLARLTEQYDNILIDSPPVLPVADALSLAAVCDAAVLILRADKSTRHDASEAFEGLRSVGVPIIGIVSNMMSRPVLPYAYEYSALPEFVGGNALPGSGGSKQLTTTKGGSGKSNGHKAG